MFIVIKSHLRCHAGIWTRSTGGMVSAGPRGLEAMGE